MHPLDLNYQLDAANGQLEIGRDASYFKARLPAASTETRSKQTTG